MRSASVFDVRVLNAGAGRRRRAISAASGSRAALLRGAPFRVARVCARSGRTRSWQPTRCRRRSARRSSLARSHAKVIVEVHGDPQTFTRLYGSRGAPFVSPLADHVAQRSLASRRCDPRASLSPPRLVEDARGVPATACFPTYSDLSAFADTPLASVPRQRLVFVGALEAYKNVAGSLRPGDRSPPRTRRAPDDRRQGLAARRRGQTRCETCPVGRSPSRSFAAAGRGRARRRARARAAVVARGLGRSCSRRSHVDAPSSRPTPAASDIVTDGADGMLIPPGDTAPLVGGMTRVLVDRALAERLGAAAARPTPVASDAGGLRYGISRARGPRARRRALMKLVFVTQTLDPAHGSLAQTLDLVRALAARVDRARGLCRDCRLGRDPRQCRGADVRCRRQGSARG